MSLRRPKRAGRRLNRSYAGVWRWRAVKRFRTIGAYKLFKSLQASLVKFNEKLHQRIRSLFFNAISMQLTAAGVTPGMREAWPRVAGRIFSSFSLASVVSPAMAA